MSLMCTNVCKVLGNKKINFTSNLCLLEYNMYTYNLQYIRQVVLNSIMKVRMKC